MADKAVYALRDVDALRAKPLPRLVRPAEQFETRSFESKSNEEGV